MHHHLHLLLVICGASLLLQEVTCKRLKDRIYVPVHSANFCFRRTNGTHQFGCTSDVNGNVGVVHLIRSSSDVDWLIEHGTHEPYIAAMLPKTFTNGNLKRLSESEKLAGAILLNPPGAEYSQPPQRYSDDSICPNDVSSLYKGTKDQCSANNNTWNMNGSGNMFESFPFPIFLTNDLNISNFLVNECFEKFNRPSEGGVPRDWPLCAAELKSHMYSAGNTETCLRRSNIVNIVNPTKFCDEMGDLNTFLFLNERNSSAANEEEESVIVVSTRLDTLTMFDMLEFGGDTPVTNIVTMLETARLLSERKPSFGGDVSNILFAFFYGEAFDYIGSSRFVYDMQQRKFPDELDANKFKGGQQPLLNMTQIRFVLELGQLFNVESDGKLFVHTDKNFREQELIKKLENLAKQKNLLLNRATNNILPPSSLQSFLKENRMIPGLYLSDYDTNYTNRYYHSVYDTGSGNLDYSFQKGSNQDIVKHIATVAETLAEFLSLTASNSNAKIADFSSNTTLINELLHCYLDTAKCSLFVAASNKFTPPFYSASSDKAWPQYVGVDYKPQFHGILTRNVLSYLTGEILDSDLEQTSKNCVAPADQNVYEYIFLKGESVPKWWNASGMDKPCNESADCGFCYKTLSFRRAAVSPAFVIDGYDFADSKYSAWAESVWKTSSARIFLEASPALQKGHFAIGVLVLVFSFLFVFWTEKYSSQIFGTSEENGRGSTSTGVTNDTRGEPTAL